MVEVIWWGDQSLCITVLRPHSPHHNHVPVVGELEEFDKVVALLDLGRDERHFERPYFPLGVRDPFLDEAV